MLPINNIRKIILAAVFLLLSSSSFALITNVGIDPLDQSSGARPLGLGGAFNAVTDDPNSIFYNPALIGSAKGLSVNLRKTNDYSVGAVYQSKVGNFGIGVKSTEISGFKVGSSEIDYTGNMILLGYGNEINNFSFGITYKALLSQKYISSTETLSSPGGQDLDIGLLWQALDYANLGIVYKNSLGGTYIIESQKEKFPNSIVVGTSIGLLGKQNTLIKNDSYGALLTYDKSSTSINNENKEGSAYGMEISMWDWLYFRGGGGSKFVIDKDAAYSSFGIGVKNGYSRFDLASTKDPFSGDQLTHFSFVYSPPNMILFQQAPSSAKPKQPVKQEKPAEVKRELLVIVQPLDESITYGDVVKIEGKANPKAQLLINGSVAYIEDNWNVSVVQPINIGKNLIVVEAKLNGENKKIERKVFRKAKVVIAEEEGVNEKIFEQVDKKEEEIKKKEQDIAQAKANEVDVTEREKQIVAEKKQVGERKQVLLEEKKKVQERKEKVENLVTLGVIEVSPQKSFAVEAPITRGEMLSWLVKAAGIPIPKVDSNVCDDVPPDNQYAPFIKAAFDYGIIEKPANNKFRPNDPVTDAEGQEFFKSFGVVK